VPSDDLLAAGTLCRRSDSENLCC